MPTYQANPFYSDPNIQRAAQSLAETLAGGSARRMNAEIAGNQARADLDATRAREAASYSTVTANQALARERNAAASLSEREFAVWKELDTALVDLPPEERDLVFVRDFLPRLGQVNGANAGDWALASGGLQGLDRTQMANRQLGSGMSYGSTAFGFDETPVEAFDNTTGQFSFVPQANVADPRYSPPVSMDQSKARVFNYQLSPRQQNTLTMGQTKAIPVLRSDGSQEYASEYDASTFSMGVPVDEKSDTRSVFNYIVDTPEGKQVFLTRDGVTDTSGNPLPPGGYKGTVTGGAQDVGLGTEGERRNVAFLERMLNAEQGLQDSMVAMGGQPPGLLQYYFAAPQDTFFWQLAYGQLTSDETKAFMTSAQQFLTSVLRLDSGAAVPVTEYPMYYAQFIPMPSDGPETLSRKARGREIAISALESGLFSTPEEIMAEVQRQVGAIEDTNGTIAQLARRVSTENSRQPLPEGGAAPSGEMMIETPFGPGKIRMP